MKKLATLLLLLAALAAGCGAADNADEGAGTAAEQGQGQGQLGGSATGTRGELVGEDDTVSGQSAAYRAGRTYCNLYPLAELARQEGVAAKPEAVAEAYSKFETTAKDKKEAYDGCLSALKK
jgi:hypothetical protein